MHLIPEVLQYYRLYMLPLSGCNTPVLVAVSGLYCESGTICNRLDNLDIVTSTNKSQPSQHNIAGLDILKKFCMLDFQNLQFSVDINIYEYKWFGKKMPKSNPGLASPGSLLAYEVSGSGICLVLHSIVWCYDNIVFSKTQEVTIFFGRHTHIHDFIRKLFIGCLLNMLKEEPRSTICVYMLDGAYEVLRCPAKTLSIPHPCSSPIRHIWKEWTSR